MDVTVAQRSEKEWTLTDLLGRSMGFVIETAPGQFAIRPGGKALETMETICRRPYFSLDAALAQIETHIRGVCRRLPDAQEPNP